MLTSIMMAQVPSSRRLRPDNTSTNTDQNPTPLAVKHFRISELPIEIIFEVCCFRVVPSHVLKPSGHPDSLPPRPNHSFVLFTHIKSMAPAPAHSLRRPTYLA
jgi:hypothetical protein